MKVNKNGLNRVLSAILLVMFFGGDKLRIDPLEGCPLAVATCLA